MCADESAWRRIRIGERGVEDLESAMTRALAPLLGGDVQVRITKVERCDDTVTGLEIEALLESELETKFAIG